MLMSVGMKIPNRIFAHNFITDKYGKKMSKSLGNVISPIDLLEKYPISAIRYYLIKEFNHSNDINFLESRMIMLHDHELLETFGNLMNRSLKLAKGIVPEASAYELFDLNKIRNEIGTYVDEIYLQKVLEVTYNLLIVLNEYLTKEQRWTLDKTSEEYKK